MIILNESFLKLNRSFYDNQYFFLSETLSYKSLTIYRSILPDESILILWTHLQPMAETPLDNSIKS